MVVHSSEVVRLGVVPDIEDQDPYLDIEVVTAGSLVAVGCTLDMATVVVTPGTEEILLMDRRTSDLDIILDIIAAGLEAADLVAFRNHFQDRVLRLHCMASTTHSGAVDNHQAAVANPASVPEFHLVREFEIFVADLERLRACLKRHMT